LSLSLSLSLSHLKLIPIPANPTQSQSFLDWEGRNGWKLSLELWKAKLKLKRGPLNGGPRPFLCPCLFEYTVMKTGLSMFYC
jgi:hypothetical protein